MYIQQTRKVDTRNQSKQRPSQGPNHNNGTRNLSLIQHEEKGSLSFSKVVTSMEFYLSYSIPISYEAVLNHHLPNHNQESALSAALATKAINAAPTPLPSFAIPTRMRFSPSGPISGISRQASRMYSSKPG